MLDPSPAVPRASLYLASAEDAEAGCRSVAGLPVAFRAVMAAIHAGCRSVAIPAAYRGTKVERAIARSARARAGAVWLSHGKTDLGCEPMVLLPATAVFPTSAVRALMEEHPVAVLSTSPPDAPLVLADGALLGAVEPELLASVPAGDAVRRALGAGPARKVRGTWCVRATGAETRAEAERRLYAELGSAIDTRLDQLIHRPVSRYLTRAAVALGLSPNVISLSSLALGLFAVSCLAQATVIGALVAIAMYFAAAVVDHVDGEVARLTYADSKLGEWLDVAVDTVVHAAMAMAMGVVAESVAGTGRFVAVLMAAGFAMSALTAKTSPGGDRVPRVLTRLGNRDGFYVLLVVFLLLLGLAPLALPALLLGATAASHAYWLGYLVIWFRRSYRGAVSADRT